MLEQRPYSASELLAWSRLLSLILAGSALAYVTQGEGSGEGLITWWKEKLGVLATGTRGGGVENALLGLLLNLEVIGAEIQSRAVNAEGAEVAVTGLPGEKIGEEVEHGFEVEVSQEELLEVVGLRRDELQQILDVFGAAAAGADFEYVREKEGATQLLKLRVW